MNNKSKQKHNQKEGKLTANDTDVILRQLYLAAKKTKRYNLSWDEYIDELEVIAGPENVAMAKEKINEWDSQEKPN